MAYTQIIIFKVQNSLLGLDIRDVNEIIKYQPPAEVPDLPEYWEGMINLRNHLVAVINLSKRLKLNSNLANEQTNIIVAKLLNDQMIGLMVDEVVGIYNAEEEEIEEVPRYLQRKGSHCFKNVLKNDNKLVIVLDQVKLLSVEEEEAINKIVA